MSNWIPKNKTLRFAVAAALASIALYFTGLLVVRGETKKIEELYQNSESEFSKEERYLAVKSIAESNKEPIEVLRSFFIPKGDDVKFIEEIERLAGSSGIKFEIADLDVKAAEDQQFKEDIDIKMGIEGSWGNILSFLDKLEKMPFGAVIQNVSLDAKESGQWFGFVEFIVFRENEIHISKAQKEQFAATRLFAAADL